MRSLYSRLFPVLALLLVVVLSPAAAPRGGSASPSGDKLEKFLITEFRRLCQVATGSKRAGRGRVSIEFEPAVAGRFTVANKEWTLILSSWNFTLRRSWMPAVKDFGPPVGDPPVGGVLDRDAALTAIRGPFEAILGEEIDDKTKIHYLSETLIAHDIDRNKLLVARGRTVAKIFLGRALDFQLPDGSTEQFQVQNLSMVVVVAPDGSVVRIQAVSHETGLGRFPLAIRQQAKDFKPKKARGDDLLLAGWFSAQEPRFQEACRAFEDGLLASVGKQTPPEPAAYRSLEWYAQQEAGDWRKEFYSELADSEIAVLAGHSNLKDGNLVFHLESGESILMPPLSADAVPKGALRHLFLLGCLTMTFDRQGETRHLERTWLQNRHLGRVRTVCGANGTLVGGFGGSGFLGERFAALYRTGESISDAWAFGAMARSTWNQPVTLAFGRTRKVALETLLEGRFEDEAAYSRWAVASVWSGATPDWGG